MAKYLMKYKGTYRLKAAIDQSTNDYPRDDSGGIDPSFDDIYIKCYGGAQIYHYGFSTLVAYIPSIGRGHNILKAIANDIGLPEYKTYEELYKALEDEGTVRSIMENDKEIEFIQAIVLRCGRQILISTDNMCNLHQMVINYIGKVIGWITI